MEAGRGDLIVSGLAIILCLMQKMGSDSLVTSDFGILEGLLLSMDKSIQP
jgi:exopolyphosphatase/pppGpp-phosphohydrolase